jgi:hypothetical protein
MPNTTNYSFPTPADTDLVKNGADAIRDLGDAVDTAMNTALGTKKAGMVLLNTTSFSAVSSQSFNNVFSSTYDNYLIAVNSLVGSSTTFTSMRLRVAGSDSSGTTYNRQLLVAESSSVTGIRVTSATSFSDLIGTSTTDETQAFLYISNPAKAARTSLQSIDNNQGFNTGVKLVVNMYNNNLTTAFDGFTLIPNAGTITGSVSVYGYNK